MGWHFHKCPILRTSNRPSYTKIAHFTQLLRKDIVWKYNWNLLSLNRDTPRTCIIQLSQTFNSVSYSRQNIVLVWEIRRRDQTLPSRLMQRPSTKGWATHSASPHYHYEVVYHVTRRQNDIGQAGGHIQTNPDRGEPRRASAAIHQNQDDQMKEMLDTEQKDVITKEMKKLGQKQNQNITAKQPGRWMRRTKTDPRHCYEGYTPSSHLFADVAVTLPWTRSHEAAGYRWWSGFGSARRRRWRRSTSARL